MLDIKQTDSENRLTHRHLDRKYKETMRSFTPKKTEKQLQKLWLRALRSGDYMVRFLARLQKIRRRTEREKESRRVRLELETHTLLRLLGDGQLFVADFRCLDCESKKWVWRLCLMNCKKNMRAARDTYSSP